LSSESDCWYCTDLNNTQKCSYILDSLTVDLVNLNKRDVVVISAGANDVYMNNPKFIQNNSNTKLMIPDTWYST
jgi:hypothetical protein